jgi:acetyl esterase/lipase
VTYAIDPELLPLVEMFPPSDLTDIAAARERTDALIAPFLAAVDATGVVVSDHDAMGPTVEATVPVTVYSPEGEVPDGGRPALVDLHGGGFVSGTAAMERGFGIEMARRLGVVVVVPEYRLAPEHPFPAGVEDCYSALCWAHEHADGLGIDASRLGVGGQSAGGGLSAAVALMARDRGGPALCFQFLGIPELDCRLETTSMRTFVDTPMWHRRNAELSWSMYLGPDHRPGDTVSPYASPSLATDLSGLPPAYVTTMEFDPLRDEGIRYAMALLEAGVSVELHNFPGTFHGSAAWPTAAVSKRANGEMVGAIARGLRVDPATRS